MKNLENEVRKLVCLLKGKAVQVVEPLPWKPWMDTFLQDLEDNEGNVSRAIELSEKSRFTVYKYRGRNDEFRRRWDAIVSDSIIVSDTEQTAKSRSRNRRRARPKGRRRR